MNVDKIVSTFKVFITPNEMNKIADEFRKGDGTYKIRTAEPVFDSDRDLPYDQWIEKNGRTKMCYRVRLEHPANEHDIGATNYFQSWKGVMDAMTRPRKRERDIER